MLFECLMKNKMNEIKGLELSHDLWAFGEMIRNECNLKSIDVYHNDLYLDGVDGRNSIYMKLNSYETKVKFIDEKYTGLNIEISYPNNSIYKKYSKKIEDRILTLKYSRSPKYKYVPFGFYEATINHIILDKKKKIKVTQKTQYSTARRTVILDEIENK